MQGLLGKPSADGAGAVWAHLCVLEVWIEAPDMPVVPCCRQFTHARFFVGFRGAWTFFLL